MPAIPDSKKLIFTEEVDYRSAVSEATFTKMGGSLNFLINNSTFIVGTVLQSMLTLAQFQSEIGSTKWVLCDGASVVGSDYETISGNSSIPDLVTNNRFLRQATNDGAVGTTQASANLSHTHVQNNGADGSTFGTIPMKYQISGSGGSVYFPPTYGTGTNGDRVLGNVSTASSGGSEARPNNMQVNHFIKINN